MNSQKIQKHVRKLFTESARNLTEIDELNQWYDSLNESTSKPDNINQFRAKSWSNIFDEIQSSGLQVKKVKNPLLGNWIWRAAIFLCLCGAGYGLFTTLPKKIIEDKIVAGVFRNDIGKVSTFSLPDGTKVWLSTGSQLEYAEDFPRNRKVKLSGEAFFEVASNPDFPFQIATGTIYTEVLGTSFNLKSYDETGVDLSVYSGRVKFSDQQSKIVSALLLKGERINWSSETGMSHIELFDINDLPDWRQGKITFNNAGLDMIQSTLKRWYKVEIHLEGNGGNCHYSGEFSQASLEQILETISYTLNLTYKINDAKVTIHANYCE